MCDEDEDEYWRGPPAATGVPPVSMIFFFQDPESYSRLSEARQLLSLTTSLRYQTFLFCNQRAFTRLVIRRAVEIESLLQLNLWYLGLVWFYRDFSQVPFQ